MNALESKCTVYIASKHWVTLWGKWKQYNMKQRQYSHKIRRIIYVGKYTYRTLPCLCLKGIQF